MTQGPAKQRIKEFLAPHFGDHELLDDEDMFSLGYVNSLFAMQLVAFVEQEFHFQVESEDLEMDNFRTVKSLVRLVESKAAPVS